MSLQNIVDIYLKTEIFYINLLQQSLPDQLNVFLQYASKLCSPPNTILVLLPLLHIWTDYSKRTSLISKVVFASTFSDWLNTILKWCFFGNRPYWYSQSLQQFPGTCETGPGNPSGHCMIPVAVLTIVALNFRSLKSVCVLLTVSVAVSRVFIAAHFPHQVINGTLIGYFIGKLVVRNQLALTKSTWFKYAIFLIVSGYGINFLVTNVIGIDLNWALAKATTACQEKDWIHVSTTPFATFWRISGVSVGMMNYLNYKSTRSEREISRRLLTKLILTILCLLLTVYGGPWAVKKLMNISILKNQFYLLFFTQYFSVPTLLGFI